MQSHNRGSFKEHQNFEDIYTSFTTFTKLGWERPCKVYTNSKLSFDNIMHNTTLIISIKAF